jgi:glycosyltransferase involved in cell wall biosynthesis
MTRPRPEVSVILPIFNRATFLPAAFDAIRAQQMPSLEVVVIDDGSVDESKQVIDGIAAAFPHQIRYVRQENQGAYGARNTGVGLADGQYLAFYDSDDVWRAEHLPKCVDALRQYPDVDWVYSASEIVDLESGRMLDPNCFYVDGKPRPFMRLAHESRGPLQVITDRGGVLCQIEHGLYCGLQNSVLRRQVFDRLRFEWKSRNEAEDQLFAIRAVSAGIRLAYFDAVHLRYHVHGGNSSGSAKGITVEKLSRVYRPLVQGYERLPLEIPLDAVERRALRKRIAKELFWHLGYSGYWAAGAHSLALEAFRDALSAWPWDILQWKTYLLALARSSVRRTSS